MASSSNTSLIDNSQTLVRSNIPVPTGHILCHRKWQNSGIVKHLRTKVGVVFDDRLGVVDFHLSEKITAVLLVEAEMLQTAVMKRKIVRFNKGLANTQDTTGFIVAEKTRLTGDAFKAAQSLAVIEFGMTLHPVADVQAAADLLISFSQGLSSKSVNPLNLLPQATMSLDESILKSLVTIPGLGKQKAKLLLSKFGSLQNIALASHSDISQTIGENPAKKIKEFLDT